MFALYPMFETILKQERENNYMHDWKKYQITHLEIGLLKAILWDTATFTKLRSQFSAAPTVSAQAGWSH